MKMIWYLRFKSGDIQAASGISPANIATLSGYTVNKAPLNRVFRRLLHQKPVDCVARP